MNEARSVQRGEYLVSVIIPAYNCDKYVSECIESVMSQSYQNWEMIIINDKSTDSTKKIIEQYAKEDDRIRPYNNERNMGAARTRNKGVDLSRGRFMAFLDADDYWHNEKLSRQISIMLKNNYSFTFTAYERLYTTNGKKRKIIRVPKEINYRQYLKNTIIGCQTVVIDNELFEGFRFEVGELEDVLTWMKYLKKGIRAYGLNENLAIYRVLKKSRSSNKIMNFMRYFRCLRRDQHLSIVESVYYQTCYMMNAIIKRLG